MNRYKVQRGWGPVSMPTLTYKSYCTFESLELSSGCMKTCSQKLWDFHLTKDSTYRNTWRNFKNDTMQCCVDYNNCTPYSLPSRAHHAHYTDVGCWSFIVIVLVAHIQVSLGGSVPWSRTQTHLGKYWEEPLVFKRTQRWTFVISKAMCCFEISSLVILLCKKPYGTTHLNLSGPFTCSTMHLHLNYAVSVA